MGASEADPVGLRAREEGTAAGAREREALAVLLGSGCKDAPEEARRLLAERDLAGLARLSPAELAGVHGLGRARARRLAAALALADLLWRGRQGRRPRVGAPGEVAALLGPRVAGLEQETFFALLLDAKHRLRRLVPVSLGTLTSSIVHPREVFRVAVREGVAAVIVAHNHPSGDPEPSVEDVAVTRRLHEAGRVLGIPLLDHVVLGDGAHVSIRERLGMPPRPQGRPAAAAEGASAPGRPP